MLSEELLGEGRICVVGNICRDVKTAPFRAGPELAQDGETPVDSITETVGGGGANSAFASAALGAKVAFVGKVGTDALGERLEAALRRYGVEAYLKRDPKHPTGNSLALTYASGQRHFLSCQPNNASLAFEDLDLRALNGLSHLFRADIWFSEGMLYGGNERLFRTARDLGMATSIDLNWDPQWGIAQPEEVRKRKAAVRAVLGLVDLAHGNVRELIEFADAVDLDQALKRLEGWGVKAVVVHMGSAGAGFYSSGSLTLAQAVPTLSQVHATGTGDVLSVCMMLLHSVPDARAKLELANRIVSEFIAGHRNLIPSLL